MSPVRTFNHRKPLNRQKGFGVVSALLGLLIAGLVTNGIVQNINFRNKQQVGSELSKRVAPYREAVNRYISENYSLLQTNQPVTRNNVTLAPGSAEGQSMAPRVTDLIALGYLPTNFSGQVALFDSTATLSSSLRQEPLGCVGQACEIPGFVYLSKPVRRNASEVNAVVIGQYRAEVGPDAVISTNARRTELTSAQGMSVANPVAGAPAGVVGVLVGWGSTGYGTYLVVNDIRNPNFRGDLSVRGEIKSESLLSGPKVVATVSVGAGTGTNGTECRLGEILSSGEIISRSALCVKKVAIDPARATMKTYFASGAESVAISGEDASVTLNRANGVQSIRMSGNNSEVVLKNAGGADRVVLNGDAGAIGLNSASGARTVSINGDNGTIAVSDGTSNRFQVDNSGNLRVRRAGGGDLAGFDISDGSGRAFGDVLRASSFATKGASCTSSRIYGDVANNTQGIGLLMCNGSIWVPITPVSSTVGWWCPTNDEIGASSNGTALICSGNTWVNISDRFGRRVFMHSYATSNGTWVGKPACLSGTIGSIIILTPKNQSVDVGKLNHYATDYGSYWVVSILDNTGAGVPGEAIAQTYCIYN
ncbi:hypothetical protein [Comamonas thiooxydans]|uniref:hypothetical protein n=1 Tax=Comamonas thiooxydans TaxID=363952 RepID=UPI0013F3DF42|nr:hypothetical protein [Comamonas thiooxydans]